MVTGPLVSFTCKEKSACWLQNFALGDKRKEALELHIDFKVTGDETAERVEKDADMVAINSLLSMTDELL